MTRFVTDIKHTAWNQNRPSALLKPKIKTSLATWSIKMWNKKQTKKERVVLFLEVKVNRGEIRKRTAFGLRVESRGLVLSHEWLWRESQNKQLNWEKHCVLLKLFYYMKCNLLILITCLIMWCHHTIMFMWNIIILCKKQPHICIRFVSSSTHCEISLVQTHSTLHSRCVLIGPDFMPIITPG